MKPMSSSSFHYTVVHKVLRWFAFSRPAAFLNPEYCEAIQPELLQEVEEEVPPAFDASAIKVSHIILKDRPCVVFQLPPPERAAEAYFVAVWSRYGQEVSSNRPVCGTSFRDRLPNLGTAPAIDFYTLERAAEPKSKCNRAGNAAEPLGCFCLWDAKGCHRNFGQVCAPTQEEFIQFLTEFELPKPDDDDFSAAEA